MPAAHQTTPALRSRLDEGRAVYELALNVADQLDSAHMDLWAAGVRACLDAPGTTQRQRHLVLELTRLSHTSTVRRAGLSEDIAGALTRLELGLGNVDLPAQPLYEAMRALAEHLELHGGRRWLGRLRAVVQDAERVPAARLQRLGLLLDRMAPGLPGLPEGTAPLVSAVRGRLPRRDHDRAMETMTYALQPPQPSRRLPGDGVPTPDLRG
ncbi:MAG TPA: hypothetical protein VMM13_16710 [Euzebya sp.]|nr:hypothetical protein [Euzebya sp.]